MRLRLTKAIKRSKGQCWNELLDKVEGDPWGRPYKVVMTRLRKTMPPPACSKLVRRVVAELFSQRSRCDFRVKIDGEEAIPHVTEEELMKACTKVRNRKAPGLDGIPNVALKAAIRAVPGMFLDLYNTCL